MFLNFSRTILDNSGEYCSFRGQISNYQYTKLPLFVLNKYFHGNEIKENKKDRECGTYGGTENFVQDFGMET